MPVLSFSVLYFGRSREFFPGKRDEDILSDCHEECTTEFNSCWDSCPENDHSCHVECADLSDVCDDLCDDLDDFDPWVDDSDLHVDYESCATVCDDRFDACFDACDGDEECEEGCEDEAVECDTARIEAENDWTPEEWQELEDELRNK